MPNVNAKAFSTLLKLITPTFDKSGLMPRARPHKETLLELLQMANDFSAPHVAEECIDYMREAPTMPRAIKFWVADKFGLHDFKVSRTILLLICIGN